MLSLSVFCCNLWGRSLLTNGFGLISCLVKFYKVDSVLEFFKDLSRLGPCFFSSSDSFSDRF